MEDTAFPKEPVPSGNSRKRLLLETETPNTRPRSKLAPFEEKQHGPSYVTPEDLADTTLGHLEPIFTTTSTINLGQAYPPTAAAFGGDVTSIGSTRPSPGLPWKGHIPSGLSEESLLRSSQLALPPILNSPALTASPLSMS